MQKQIRPALRLHPLNNRAWSGSSKIENDLRLVSLPHPGRLQKKQQGKVPKKVIVHRARSAFGEDPSGRRDDSENGKLRVGLVLPWRDEVEGSPDGQPTAKAQLVLARTLQQGWDKEDRVDDAKEESWPYLIKESEDPLPKAYKGRQGGDLWLEVFQEEPLLIEYLIHFLAVVEIEDLGDLFLLWYINRKNRIFHQIMIRNNRYQLRDPSL